MTTESTIKHSETGLWLRYHVRTPASRIKPPPLGRNLLFAAVAHNTAGFFFGKLALTRILDRIRPTSSDVRKTEILFIFGF